MTMLCVTSRIPHFNKYLIKKIFRQKYWSIFYFSFSWYWISYPCFSWRTKMQHYFSPKKKAQTYSRVSKSIRETLNRPIRGGTSKIGTNQQNKSEIELNKRWLISNQISNFISKKEMNLQLKLNSYLKYLAQYLWIGEE